MLRDVEVIETLRTHQPSRWSRLANSADARVARHRFHLIEAGRFTSALAPESKAKPDLELLTYLHGAGRSETEKWLARSRADVGRRATVDLVRHFLSERAAPAPAAAGRRAPPEAAA
jgi:NTE family protein